MEAVCAALQAAPGAPFGFADSGAIDGAGSVLWPDHQAYYQESGTALLESSRTIEAEAFLRECLGARNLVLNASAVVWRRRSLRDALARMGDPGLRLAVDWRLYAEALSLGGSVAYVGLPLNQHRRHTGGITGSTESSRHLDEIGKMHRHMRELIGPDKALAGQQRKALAAAKRELEAAIVS